MSKLTRDDLTCEYNVELGIMTCRSCPPEVEPFTCAATHLHVMTAHLNEHLDGSLPGVARPRLPGENGPSVC